MNVESKDAKLAGQVWQEWYLASRWIKSMYVRGEALQRNIIYELCHVFWIIWKYYYRTLQPWPLAMAPQLQTSSTRCQSDPGDLCSYKTMLSLRRWHTLTGEDRGGRFLKLFYNIILWGWKTFFRERIPERVVHAKGAGAFGYFEVTFLYLSVKWRLLFITSFVQVTHDISKYCKAAVFSKVRRESMIIDHKGC